MSDDIVNRLHVIADGAQCIEREAADEIERLRAEVAHETDMACQVSVALWKVSLAIGDNRYLDPPDGGDVTLAKQVQRMRADRDRLHAALELAIEEVEFWSGYADTYFRDKHDLAHTLGNLRAALAGQSQGSGSADRNAATGEAAP